jgi:hypothetical protein
MAAFLHASGTKPLLLRNCNITNQTLASLPCDENFTWDVLWARKFVHRLPTIRQRDETTLVYSSSIHQTRLGHLPAPIAEASNLLAILIMPPDQTRPTTSKHNEMTRARRAFYGARQQKYCGWQKKRVFQYTETENFCQVILKLFQNFLLDFYLFFLLFEWSRIPATARASCSASA